MDLLNNLALGLSVAVSFQNLLYALLGCMVGTLIGVLPGIGPVATIAMLLPITFHLPPTAALIMLAGIYYGAQYGGSTTAILVNLPGEASLGRDLPRRLPDGAQGPRRRGAVDLGRRLVLRRHRRHLIIVDLRRAADAHGAEVRAGRLLLADGAGPGRRRRAGAAARCIKAIAMVFLGLLFGLVGTDVNTGAQRFTFDIPELSDGIDFAPHRHGPVRHRRDRRSTSNDI